MKLTEISVLVNAADSEAVKNIISIVNKQKKVQKNIVPKDNFADIERAENRKK